MAPKKLLEDPPPASSSTEEEVSSEEEENDAVEDEEQNDAVEEEDEEDDDEEDDEEDEDEEEKSKSSVKNPIGTSSITPQPDSEDESGSESESDSDQTQPSPTASDFTVKPIASKPMEDSPKPKKSGPKPNTASASATATPTSKRPAESDPNAKDSKKKKVMNGDDEDSKKGTGNPRLWSEDDEIVILKGMTEYQSKNGSDPYADMGAFHEFIKKSLHVEVSKSQLMDKIRRLRKKFQVNAEKGENGEDPVFSKSHEHQSFELSKKIWGSEANGKGKRNARQSGKVNNKNNSSITLALPKQKEGVKEVVMMNGMVNGEVRKDLVNGGVKKADPDDFWAKYPFLSESLTSVPELGGCLLRERMSVIENAKVKDLDEKWRKIQIKEFELYLKRIELLEEQGKLFLDALKKSMD